MDPASVASAAEVYKAAGIVGVLLLIIAVIMIAVWRSMVAREVSLMDLITENSKQCQAREQALGVRLTEVEDRFSDFQNTTAARGIEVASQAIAATNAQTAITERILRHLEK